MLNPSITPRDYQKAIFETSKNHNTLVVLPTGIGKTLVAIMLSIERMHQHPSSKILMLAPTKPLVEQHLKTFQNSLSELFADLQLFTGEVPAKKRQHLFQTADIIFSTPQCIANDLRNSLYDLEEVSLLTIDECHRCLKNYDYTYVANQYKSQAKNPRILGLTASPGHDTTKVKEICKHLSIEEVEIRSRYSQDVKPYLQELEFQKILVPFPQEFQEIKTLLKILYDKKVEQLQSRNLLFPPINKITLLKLQASLANQASQRNFNALAGMSLTAQAIKLSHALELLETQTLSGLFEYLKKLKSEAEQKKSKGVQTLVNSQEFQASFLSLQQLLEKNIEHPKINELKTLIEKEFQENPNSKIIVFAQFRETVQRIVDKLKEIPNVKPSIFIGQAKKINSKTPGISQKEQKQIIQDFRENKINLISCTSIGEEGLDIPEVSAVFFYEPIPSEIRKIQRAGRTARLSPGKLIILMTKDTRDIAHHYASLARERKMHRILDEVKDEIQNKKDKTLLGLKHP